MQAMIFFDGFSVVVDCKECSAERMRKLSKTKYLHLSSYFQDCELLHPHIDFLVSIGKERMASRPLRHYLVTVGIGSFSLFSTHHPHHIIIFCSVPCSCDLSINEVVLKK